MKKKHYVMLAKLIKQATDSKEKHLINKDQLLSSLVEELKNDNPAFDGFRFMEACQ